MEGAVHVEAANSSDARAMLRVHRAAIRTTARAFHDQAVIDAWDPLPIRPEQVARFADRIARGEEEAVVARTTAGELVG